MASYRSGATVITWTTAAGAKAATIAAIQGDYLVAFVAHDASAPDDHNVTEDAGGTWDKVPGSFGLFLASVASFSVWVRRSKVHLTRNIIVTTTPAATTGGGICVIAVSGMYRAGLPAVRSVGIQQNRAGGGGDLPTPVLSNTPLLTSFIAMMIVDGTNGSSNAAARTAVGPYTEIIDQGYNTPATGIEIQYLNSGETTATLNTPQATPTGYGSVAIELDATNPALYIPKAKVIELIRYKRGPSILSLPKQWEHTYVQSTLARVHTTDAIIFSTKTLLHTTDAIIKSTLLKTHTTDAVIKSTLLKTHTTDAIIKSTLLKTHTTDAVIKSTLLKTHTTDAVIKSTLLKTHTTDAVIEAGAEQHTIEHTTDAVIKSTLTRIHTTDAIILKTLSRSHTTDAYIEVPGQHIVEHTADAVIKSTLARTHTTDAIIVKTTSILHTTDAVIKSTLARVHTTDAVIKSTLARVHTTDAVILNTLNQEHTTDAFIIGQHTVEHTTDAVIKSTLTQSHTTDAAILKTLSQSHTTDAYIVNRTILAHTTDAIIEAGLITFPTPVLFTRRKGMIRDKQVILIPDTAFGDAANSQNKQINYGRPGCVRAISVDYSASDNAERSLVLRADSSTGRVLYGPIVGEVDLAPTAAVQAGIKSDGAAGDQVTGWYFSSGLYIHCDDMDDIASVTVTVWVEL